MTETKLLPCPWCGSAPFFHPELSDGSTRLECGGDCCPMEETYTPRGSREFVITVWNRRPLPAARADPEAVEAARRVNVAIKSIAGKRIPIKFPNDEIAMVFTTIIENAGKVARALLANATDEMPPARRAEGEQPSTSYVRTEK